jgi:hypothetical protein
MEERNEERLKTNSFGTSDIALTLTYSKQLTVNSEQIMAYGINIKFVKHQRETERTTGLAFDFGLLTHLPYPLQLGFSIRNFGPRMKFINEGYSLPLVVAFGLGYKLKNRNICYRF